MINQLKITAATCLFSLMSGISLAGTFSLQYLKFPMHTDEKLVFMEVPTYVSWHGSGAEFESLIVLYEKPCWIYMPSTSSFVDVNPISLNNGSIGVVRNDQRFQIQIVFPKNVKDNQYDIVSLKSSLEDYWSDLVKTFYPRALVTLEVKYDK